MKISSGTWRYPIMVGVSGGALLYASAVFAQAAAPATEPPPAAQPTGAPATQGLQEVVVTAQKRTENIRDVPISITALSGAQIQRAGVTNTLELTELVPGLKLDNVGSTTVPAIRGISTYLTNVGTDDNVSTYVDNIYVSSAEASILDLPDISRIDVLKGPQGTLFGRNATGGAIQIFTKDPQFTPQGDFSVSYGNYNDLAFKGFVTGPLIPGVLAGSLSAYDETADSYDKNLNPSVPFAKIDNYLVRGKLLFTPTDTTRVLFTAYTGQHSDPDPVTYSALDGITAAKATPGAIIPTQPWQAAFDIPVNETERGSGVNVQINQKTDIGDFNMYGSYAYLTGGGWVDITPGAYPKPYLGNDSNVNDQSTSYSGEVDFASKKFGPFSFIAGANYYYDSDKWNPLAVEAVLPGASTLISLFAGQTSSAYAFYGEATYQITDKLSIVGGLRYSNELRAVSGSGEVGLLSSGPFYNFGSHDFGSITQRVSVRYKITPETNAYFTYSTGFKSGNYVATNVPFGVTPAQCAAENVAKAGTCAVPTPLLPETISAFEIGIKSQPLSWLRVDAALFDYKLKDIQIQNYTNVCEVAPCPPNPEVQLSQYSNAAAAQMYGAEINVDAQVTPELRLGAGLSLLDAHFSSYETAAWLVPAPGGIGLNQTPTMSADGKELPRAPKATVDVTATWTKELDPGTFSFTATGYYSDKIYYDVGNIFYQPAYATLNLQASFSPARLPNLMVTLWGNNLTNAHVILGAVIGQSAAAASYAAPTTFGVKVGYKF